MNRNIKKRGGGVRREKIFVRASERKTAMQPHLGLCVAVCSPGGQLICSKDKHPVQVQL